MKHTVKASSGQCVRCQQAITPTDKTEPYTMPSDGRHVHTKCVGDLIRECLQAMAAIPAEVRLLDFDDEQSIIDTMDGE